MNFLELLAIARRYTFTVGQGYLSSFLSSLSMLGLVLAITLLITVLSVMNGFDKEMRERILSLVPHITVHAYDAASDWRAAAAVIEAHPDVVSVQPFVQFDALFMRGTAIETARGTGLDTDSSPALIAALPAEAQDTFRQEPGGLILGSGIAERLGASVGDALTLIVPSLGGGRDASASRFETVTLSAILDSGTELDQAVAVVHLALAAQLLGDGDAVSGLQVMTADLFDVAGIGWELMTQLPPAWYVTNWTMTHGNLYAAIQLSRDLVSILLFSIIAVAAFNVVSSLVLVVFDKRGDIAILRTLGASPRQIGLIFVLQGAMIGLVGVGLGSVAGVALSRMTPGLVAWLEQLLDIRFLSTDVYPVAFLPVEVIATDIVLVGSVAFLMCLLAAIYPALRAARLSPALVLHEDSA